jgi:hypothetical protein
MKGQAAVEYLMTYGWAILALVIVVAALFTTGVFSPSYLVAEECNFGNSLRCEFAMFNEGGSTKLMLTVFNGYPYKVRINDILMQSQDGAQQFNFVAHDAELESGASASFEASLGGDQLPENSIKRFVGNMTYVSCAPEIGPDCSTVEHIASGRITGRVIPK